MKLTLRTDFIGILLLLSISLALGILINQFRDQPLPYLYNNPESRISAEIKSIQSDQIQIPISNTPKETNLTEVKNLIEEKKVLILDARPEIFHRLGHLPGALSLPRESFKETYQQLKSKLEPYKESPIVIYCSGASCHDSHLVAEALIQLGYKRVLIYSGGWSEWSDHQEKTEKSS